MQQSLAVHVRYAESIFQVLNGSEPALSGTRARILYLPNERGDGRQSGPRLALAQLREAGLVEDVQTFSYLWRLSGDAADSVFNELMMRVRAFKPTIVLVQHPSGTGLVDQAWKQLREAARFRMVYHEGDAYDRFRKKVPAEMRSAAAFADVSFSVGASQQLQLLRAAGSVDARWTPSIFNPHIFGKKVITSNKDVDIVMIANESSSRIPLKSIPDSRRRAELVRKLMRHFGKRFAVYGRGWSGPSARGPLNYNEQEEVIQSAWISTGWDHYTSEAKFFSDRLPIALVSGTIHVTSSHPGYGDLFPPDLGFIHHEPSVAGVVKRIDKLLSQGDESTFVREMDRGRQFALANFRQDDNFVGLLNAGGAAIEVAAARRAWDLKIEPVSQL